MKIGFFDSGLGGLSVFNKIVNDVNACYIYLADNKNTPYGIKRKNEVLKYVEENIKILVELKCDIIVIACNTATSIAINHLRELYKDICIIGTEPAIKSAANDRVENKEIIVSATTMTLREEKLNNLIKKLNIENIIKKVALDKLVEYAENDNYDENEVKEYLKDKLKDINLNNCSHFVLGCTHFPLFEKEIKEVIPNNIKVIDGSTGIINNVKRKIKENNLEENKTTVKLLLTKESNIFVNNFKRISKINDIEISVIK